MINFRNVTMDALNLEHPERLRWGAAWVDYEILYKGGLEFKRAAGMVATTVASLQAGNNGLPFMDLMANRGRRRRFLFQLEAEPDTKYVSRWERCFYTNYIGVIVDYFRHWLFSQQPQIRPKIEVDPGQDLAEAEEPEAPEWFAPFMSDAKGDGTSFYDLGKQVFGDTLIFRLAGWLIGIPDQVGQQPDDNDGDEDPPICLTPYNAREIYDWQEDANGCLEWILLGKKSYRREFPDERREVEIRTYIDRDSWAAWEIINNPDDPNAKQPELIGSGQHGLGEVPFEWLTVPEGLWVLNKLAASAVDLFNQESMLSAMQLEACFLQPYIKSTEGTEDATNRILGSGVVLHLRAQDEKRGAEEFGWAAPSIDPLKFSSDRLLQQRDEIYRIVHQMSLAVDSQAIGAIARSGASKIEDRKATEIMLCAYGGYVRDFFLRTLNKISRMLGDDTEWVIDGYDNFEVSSLLEELQLASLAQTFNIESPTFNAEMQKSIATGRLLSHLDDVKKAKIAREIDERVEMKAELVTMGAVQINPVTGQPMPPEPTPAGPGEPSQPPKANAAKAKGPPVKDS